MSEDRFAKAIQAAARARAGQATERSAPAPSTGIDRAAARAAEIRSQNTAQANSAPKAVEAMQPATVAQTAAPAAQAALAAPVAPAAPAMSSARLFRAYRKPAGGYEIAPSASTSLPAGAKVVEDAALSAQLSATGWTGFKIYGCGFVTGTPPAV